MAASIVVSLLPARPTLTGNKSTTPSGSGDLVTRIVGDHAPDGAAFAVVANPDFSAKDRHRTRSRHPTGSSVAHSYAGALVLGRLPTGAVLVLAMLPFLVLARFHTSARGADEVQFRGV